MAFNPYFPATYGNPYQMQMMQQYQQQMQPVQQSQNFTQPTIHADIVQINGDEEEANAFPVQTGGTQMMINKTEDKIFIKTVYANNQTNLDVFVKQKPQTEQKKINYDDFVTWDMLEKRLAQIAETVPNHSKGKKEEQNEQLV